MALKFPVLRGVPLVIGGLGILAYGRMKSGTGSAFGLCSRLCSGNHLMIIILKQCGHLVSSCLRTETKCAQLLLDNTFFM
jgi:hypothetical protein